MKKNRKRAPHTARFFLIALLVPLIMLGAGEIGMRLAGIGNDLALFIPAPQGFSDRELLMVNPDVARRYFPEDRFVPRPLRDFFARKKPANAYRIFVMGESATAGFPYPGNVAFSRILQGRLADAFPDRAIEVINVAVTATNTYALVDFIDEILAQQPDAVLIYAGHNEFYGALGAASTVSLGKFQPQLRAYLLLRRLRLFQAVELGLARLKAGGEGLGEAPVDAGLGFTLMGRMSDRANILLGGPTYVKARAQFEANLRAVLAKAQAAGVAVILSELVSNLRDRPPFASAANETLPRAEEVFRVAQGLEEKGDYAEARNGYARARDLDVLRFRAPGEFNDIIHRIAGDFSVPVVPMTAVFEAASQHGLLGSGLMLEHLHPNVEGQMLMSEAFLETMRKRGLIAAQWEEKRLKPLGYYRDYWPVSDLDRALGAVRIRRLTDYWPFKAQEEAGREWPQYRPADLVGMLAHRVATNRMRLSEARVELARRYFKEGRRDAGLRELRSLAADGAWDLQAQLVAAQQLIEARHYVDALPFLRASLQLKKTSYALEWIDRISTSR